MFSFGKRLENFIQWTRIRMRKFTRWRESLSSLICPKVFQTPSEKISGHFNERIYAFLYALKHRLPAQWQEAEICLTIIKLKRQQDKTATNKMKKKNLIKVLVATSAAIVLTASGIAASGNWIKVSDPDCNKCKITQYEYTCGKCGSGMSSSCKWDSNHEYLIYTFTCKDRYKKGCTHSCTYKTKG